MSPTYVALAPFLRNCPSVITLGVRGCIDDYSPEEKKLLMRADRILYPTRRFLDVFQAAHRPVFPRPTTTRYLRSLVHQRILFQYTRIPCPPGRIYYGLRQKEKILRDFSLPFTAAGPTPWTARHRIEDPETLFDIAARYNPVIITEDVSWEGFASLICVNFTCVAILVTDGTRGMNLPEGTPAALDSPEYSGLLDLTTRLIRMAHLDDVVLSWGLSGQRWMLMELTAPPLRWRTQTGIVHRFDHLCEILRFGRLK